MCEDWKSLSLLTWLQWLIVKMHITHGSHMQDISLPFIEVPKELFGFSSSQVPEGSLEVILCVNASAYLSKLH